MFSIFTIALWLALTAASKPDCERICQQLTHLLPQQTQHGPSAKSNLWSLSQSQVSARCRVEPAISAEVAQVLNIILHGQCRFSVLGGGGGASSLSRGSSNVDNGMITIDLQRLNSIDVRLGSRQVHVGGGVRWGDVYRVLNPLNVSAVGTRSGRPGVVGSILGGGISFFSQSRGWACDNVLEFEVVLANSSIVRASESRNRELFWALRGGGSNFGIVSSVVIETFVKPASLYVFRRWHVGFLHRLFTRLDGLTRAMPADLQMVAVTFAWSPRHRDFILSERVVSSQPSGAMSTGEQELRHMSSLENLLPNDRPFMMEEHAYVRTTLQMAQVMDYSNEEGYFNAFGSVTIRNDADLCQRIAEIYQQEMPAVVDIDSVRAYIVYNSLTVETMRHMQKRGGNALGLEEDEPLIIVNVNMRWRHAADTDTMSVFMQTLLDRFTAAAESAGQAHPYVFLNHCFETQEPLRSYGRGNYERLHAIKEAVDPHGLFQLLQEAHHRLGSDERDLDRTVKSELQHLSSYYSYPTMVDEHV